MSCCHSISLDVGLAVVEDMIEFEGAFYGGWTFFVAPEHCKRPDDGFRDKPRSNFIRGTAALELHSVDLLIHPQFLYA